MQPDAVCPNSSVVSSPLCPRCPSVETHSVRHPILVCVSVLSPVSWSGSVSSSVSCCASVLLPHHRAAGPPGVFQCPPAHSVPIYIIHVQCPYTNDFVIQNLLRHGILAQYYWVTEIFEKNNMWPKNKANECFKSLYLGVKHNAVSVENSGLCHC